MHEPVCNPELELIQAIHSISNKRGAPAIIQDETAAFHIQRPLWPRIWMLNITLMMVDASANWNYGEPISGDSESAVWREQVARCHRAAFHFPQRVIEWILQTSRWQLCSFMPDMWVGCSFWRQFEALSMSNRISIRSSLRLTKQFGWNLNRIAIDVLKMD